MDEHEAAVAAFAMVYLFSDGVVHPIIDLGPEN